MILRVLLPAFVRIGGALGLNVLLLAALVHLNRVEPVQAEPEVVARLRFAEPLPPQRQPQKALPQSEPLPEEVPALDLPEPELPQPEIEPLELSAVLPAAHVPVFVRAVPRPAPVARTRAADVAREPGRRPPPAPQRVAESGEVDEPPRDLRVVRPEYPRSAVRRGIEGSATVRLLIDEEGCVHKVELVDVRGSDRFGDAVLSVAPHWTFTPARDHGRNVRVWALKTVRFRLEDRP